MASFLSRLFGRRAAPVAENGRRKRWAQRSTGRPEFVVIGLGRFGSSVATTLAWRGFTVVGVDSDMDLVQKHANSLKQTLKLDSTDEAALREMEITAYDTVVVAIGADFEASLMTTVALNKLHVRNIVCKAATQVHRDLLMSVGAHRVILPEYEAGEHLALELAQPAIIDDLVIEDDVHVCALEVPEVYVGLMLGDLKFKERLRLDVLALRRDNTSFPSPDPSTVLEDRDVMVVMGAPADVLRLAEL